MGFLSRFRGGDDEPEEQLCPKCRMPAPVARRWQSSAR